MGSFVVYILLASLFHAVYPNDIDGCPPIHVKKNRILRTKQSLNNGAKFIHHKFVNSAKECYKLCCETEGCNLGMLSYKNSTIALGEVIRTCYLFDCGSPSKCTFSSYDHYATIEFEESRGKPNKIDQNPKSGSTNTHEENCPPGVPVAMCRNDPCINAVCPGSPLAFCKPSFCGSCHAEFYDDDGKKVNCYCEFYFIGAWRISNVTPLGIRHFTYNSQCKRVSKYMSWDRKTQCFPEVPINNCFTQNNEVDNTKNSNKYKWLDSGIFGENDKHHSTTYQNPVHNAQDLESRLHEMTRNNQQSRQSTRVSSSRTNQDQHRDSWNGHGSDGSKHQAPAHTSRGSSSSHRKQKPAPTDPPFHQWRKFIDNNPDYPTKKLATEKPTLKPKPKKTPKPKEESTKPFHQWREFIDNNPKYDKKPKTTKTQHPTKPHITPKMKPNTKENTHKPVGTKIPPKVDNDSTSNKRNITDVKVVIETNDLRIVENKAVVPLAIFLVIALLLLVMVGLRLRMMKNRLRRKAFATDDADYLINGMYL